MREGVGGGACDGGCRQAPIMLVENDDVLCQGDSGSGAVSLAMMVRC